MAALTDKRPLCAACLRPQSACICQWVTPVESLVEVLILQHPLEVNNAKGSARLLHLSLPHSRLQSGEAFDTQAFGAQRKHDILLYPDTLADSAIPAPPTLDAAWLQDPSQVRLIVLDGTWRKSRKMLYQSPPLQHLPRLALQGLGASRYLIRKAHKPDQLSTLEATCAALMQLERSTEKFQPLLNAFDGFVAQQLAYRQY